MRPVLGLLVILAATGFAAAASAAPPPAMACAALAKADFSRVPDAPMQITSAAAVAASDQAPAHCLASGYVTPAIGLDIRLPEDWNGKVASVGCGGFCGAKFPLAACAGLLARHYACIVSDMGHSSSGLDGKWAYNNLQAKFDFGVRTPHVQAVAVKAIAQAYYGAQPSRSYFMGCSTGGRQAMFAAQRFPTDFDGVIAGAPVINETGDSLALIWNVLALQSADGKPMLTFDEVRAVHAAAVAACDMNDGVKDGLIGDARRCRFDPAQTPGLSKAQAAAVAKLYAGPVDSAGRRLTPVRALPGSELNWLTNYLGTPEQDSTYAAFVGDLFRYMAFFPDPGPTWQPKDMDWDRDPARLQMMEALYNAQNPDLRAFKAHGGKLLVYQGWADQSVLPEWSTDYNEIATRAMGGRAATQDFYRLFMIPGMNHCLGGEGAHRIDYLAALDQWVETGKAPDRLIAQHPKSDTFSGTQYGLDPLPASQVSFSRPVFPYPLEARYSGRGDVNDVKSFVAQ